MAHEPRTSFCNPQRPRPLLSPAAPPDTFCSSSSGNQSPYSFRLLLRSAVPPPGGGWNRPRGSRRSNPARQCHLEWTLPEWLVRWRRHILQWRRCNHQWRTWNFRWCCRSRGSGPRVCRTRLEALGWCWCPLVGEPSPGCGPASFWQQIKWQAKLCSCTCWWWSVSLNTNLLY